MKCFTTKYQASINADILKLGRFRIKFHATDNPTKSNRKIEITTSSNSNITISNGYFTDENLTSNLGTSVEVNGSKILYVSNTEAEVELDKYANNITALSTNADIDIRDMRFDKVLDSFYSPNSFGDISNLKDCPRISLLISNKISGDIKYIKDMQNMQSIILQGNVYGSFINSHFKSNIANISFPITVNVTVDELLKYSNLNTIMCSLNENIDRLSNLSKLVNVSISGKCTGDISTFLNLANLKNLVIPSSVTHTDEQIKTLTDKGVTVTII